MKDCIFCRIIRGELPASKVFECEDYLIIKDAYPCAKVHLLIIPKEHYVSFAELTAQRSKVVGDALLKVNELASSVGLSEGYRIVSNVGYSAGQRVMHTHIHVMGGETLSNKLVRDEGDN